MNRILKLVPLALLLLFIQIAPAHANVTYEVQVGAWAENESIGNIGVSVEIQTKALTTTLGDLQYFWVGSILENGGFIQFGYAYEPGTYCLTGSVLSTGFTCTGTTDTLGASDARWMWQYWPSAYGKDFFFGIGLTNSVGVDKSWHQYAIIPNTKDGWNFNLDGKIVDSITNHYGPSKYAASFVAEKGSSTPTLTGLGPVEFRNLAYLTHDDAGYVWHFAKSLYAIVGCAYGMQCTSIPYGVASDHSGIITTGTGVRQATSLTLLWSKSG
jgi:hypothetical protein